MKHWIQLVNIETVVGIPGLEQPHSPINVVPTSVSCFLFPISAKKFSERKIGECLFSALLPITAIGIQSDRQAKMDHDFLLQSADTR